MTNQISRENHILSPDGVISIYEDQHDGLEVISLQLLDTLRPDKALLTFPISQSQAVQSIRLSTGGFQIFWQNEAGSKTIEFSLSPHNLYTVEVTLRDKSRNVLQRLAIVAVLNAEMESLLTQLLSNQNDKSSAWPMLSPERFMIYNTYKSDYNYKGKRIFLSGCGSGAEIPALLALGAAEVHAHDVSQVCLDFVRARFADMSSVKPTMDPRAGDQKFDFVISRHVIEHVPTNERSAYMASLCDRLKPNGRLILDVPNQKCPIEPHTEIAFFHLLDQDAKLNAIRYFENAGTEKERAQLPALRSLVHHTNLAPRECEALVPEGFRTIQLVDIDPRVPSIDVEISGTFRLIVERA